MRHAMPWNVKGVDADARDAAREAAQRAGMTLGEWLNHVISANAADAEPDVGVSDVAARLESVTERLETMNRRASDVAIPRVGSPKRDDREIVRALDAVARLAEISERRSAEALKAVHEARMEERAAAARPTPARRIDPDERRPAPFSGYADADRIADERRLAAIVESVAGLSRAIDQIGSTRPPAPRAAAPSDPLSLAAAVRAAASSTAHERPRPFDLDLKTTIATIADRQRALDGEAAVPVGRATQSMAMDGVAALAERLDRMQADISALRHAPPAQGEDRQRAAYLADLKDISGRIDAINRAPDPTLQRDIHQIARKLDQLGASAAPTAPDVAPSLARLAQEIEGFRRDFLNRGSDRSEEALAGLRHDIATLADAIHGLAPRSAVERLRDDIDALGSKLTDARRQGGGSAALEQLVGQLEEAVRRMTPVDGLSDDVRALARKIDGMGGGGGVDGDTLRHLADEAEDIRKAVGRAARQDSVDQIADDVRALAERVEARIDQSRQEPQRLADLLGARIEELAARLDRGPRAEGEQPVFSDTRSIEDAMGRLVAKLDDAQRRDGRPDALDALEQQIVALAAKIDRRDGSDKLGAIERGLSDLFVQLEEMRASAVDSAERAARAALAASGGERGGGVDVEAIRRDMQDLKAQARAAETQTYSTLDAVQKTLEKVVSRVAALDEAPRAALAASPPKPAPAPASHVHSPIAAPLELTRPVASAPPAAPVDVAPEPPRPRPAPPAARDEPPAPAAKSAPSPRPAAGPVNELLIEPRSGAPRARPAAGAAGPGPKGDFIAAARRAAQAAAAEAASAPAPSRKDQAASLLGKLTGKGGKANDPAPGPRVEPPAPAVASHVVEPVEIEAAPDDVERVKSGIAAKRRTILLGVAAAIILLAAGFATISNFRGIQASAPPPAGEPARVESSTGSEPAAPVRSVGVSRIQPSDEAPATNAPAPSSAPAAASPRPPAPQAQLDGPITTGSVAEATRPPTPPGATISTAGWQPVGRDPRPARPTTIPAQLRLAAERGEAAAQFELATRHLEGRGTPVDAREAARLYRLAADQGLAPAQYRLGSLLEKGAGVPRDVQEARRLYEAAARAGNGKAMHNLAVLFAQGALGERPDYRQASSWFRRAAEHGVTDSQYNLAILYARGLGVETNLGESFKWFALAGAGGDQDARKKSEEIAARLDAQSLVAARLAVQTFAPRPEPEDAVGVTPPAGGWGDAPTAQRAAPTRPPVAAAR